MALTDLRRAYQQSYRAKQKKFSSEAIRTFDRNVREINKSDLSRAEKSRLKNEVARKLLESGMSTKTGIERAYQKALDERGKRGDVLRDKKLSTTEKAHYVMASDHAKTVIEAKKSAGSEQVKYAADVYGNDSDSFYDKLEKVIDEVRVNPDATPSELNDIILEGAEE